MRVCGPMIHARAPQADREGVFAIFDRVVAATVVCAAELLFTRLDGW
jgi:hypothetical protein